MLLAKKIRLDVSAQDAATLEFMQAKCRGLYNWWVMRLRAGERWNWQDAKKTLAASRTHDPELDQVYGKLQDASLFSPPGRHAGLLPARGQWREAGLPPVRPRHRFFTLCYPAAYLLFEGKRLMLPTGGKGHHKRFPNIRAQLS